MQGHPDFRVASGCKFKLARKDADDADAFIVELYGTAKDTLVATEPTYPGTISEDGDFWPRGDVLARGEVSAQNGFDAEHGEEIDGGLGAKDHLGLSCAMKGEAVATEPGKGLEGAGLVCPIEVIGVGGVPNSCIQRGGLSFLGAHFAKGDQAVRLPVGKWAHERCVDNGKDGGVRANPQGQGDDGDDGKAGIVCEHSKTITDVVEKVLNGRPPPDIAGVLLHQRHVPKLKASRKLGVFPRHAIPHQSCHLFFKVFPNLFGEIAVKATPRNQLLEPVHDAPLAKTRVIPSSMRSNLETSRSKCFAPAAVTR